MRKPIFWRLKFTVVLVVICLVGCTIQPTTHSFKQDEPHQAPKNTSSDKLQLSNDFANNQSADRAFFGIGAADCIPTGKLLGIYVVSLHQTSVAKRMGLSIGDKILEIGGHKPKNTKELTYIIKRLTPDTVHGIVFERQAGVMEVLVVPPAWIPSEVERKKIDMPYQNPRNLCAAIGLNQS